jgi:hypothetical protein
LVPEEVARVSGAIAAAAETTGIAYIDPVAEHWLAEPQMFGEDQVHPSTDGYREYAQRVIDHLKLIGLESSCNS